MKNKPNHQNDLFVLLLRILGTVRQCRNSLQSLCLRFNSLTVLERDSGKIIKEKCEDVQIV